jgi:hypothetical protein
MTGAEGSVLQYGALGLLAIVLVAVAAYLRESARRDSDRQAARDLFMQSLFDRVTGRLDAIAQTQQQTAIALGELCRSLNSHAERSENEHAEILQRAKQRPPRIGLG